MNALDVHKGMWKCATWQELQKETSEIRKHKEVVVNDVC